MTWRTCWTISPPDTQPTYWPSGIAGWPFLLLSGMTDYTLHGRNIVHMTQGSNNLHFFYDASNKPAIVEFNGTKYAYVHNLQGDIVAILDNDGTAVVQYKYDAWGRQIDCTFEAGNDEAEALSALNPFRYRGYVYDEETGLYYLRSRYQNATWCRFINMDTIVGDGGLMSHNLYCYCLNIPVAGKDTNGLDFQDCLSDFVTDAANFASAVWDGMEQRFDTFVETPNIDTFLNWMTMGITQYNGENALSMIEDPTLYNIVNYISIGIPDTLSGALDPEEPLSFDHWLCSATLFFRARMATPYMKAAAPYVKSAARSSTLWFAGLNKGKALMVGKWKIFYATPNSGGGVLLNYKGNRMQFRIDCDNEHFLHMHFGRGKTLDVHRQINRSELKKLIQYIKNLK